MSAKRHSLAVLTLTMAAGVALSGVSRQSQAQAPIKTFTAQYSVEYEGQDRGEATFSLTHDAATDTYTYMSQTKLKGLAVRLLAPNPIVDKSRFRYENGRVVPIEFTYEDGSRKGDGNEHVMFDWSAGSAELMGENGTKKVSIAPGTQDRSSAQIALMLDLAAGTHPESVMLADGESVDTYDYTFSDPQTVDTGIGRLEVVTVTQQRPGSSRHNVYRIAPSVGNVPISIEQYRGDELRFAWRIEKLD